VSDSSRQPLSPDETASLMEAVFEQASVGIGIVALDGTFLRVNPMICNICGLPADAMIGRRLTDVVHPDDRARVELVLRQLKDGALARAVLHHRMVFREGEVRDVKVSASAIKDPGGEVSRLVGVVEDVTEHKQALQERARLEVKIRHAQKLESLGVLAGGIAHDFNNLLVGMLGNASLAALDVPADSPAHRYLEDIERTANRASGLARQMLAYSGRGRFLVERLDLGQLVKEMVHLLEASLARNATLRLDLDAALPPVDVDATQIRQVVMNLITNASDALGEDAGTIEVTTELRDCDRDSLAATYLDEDLPPGRYVVLRVCDSGCGMTREVAERIFDPFFTTKFQGRGLGLAAVLGIVRGHRGALRVVSEEGKGTTLEILLPAAAGPHAAGPVEETSDTDRLDIVDGGRILLVDDEPGVRGVARAMLEHLGYEVVEAVDGRDAVEQFGGDPQGFAGVLLDLTMPRMDGEQCFGELRRIRPDVRVLLSSGYNEQELETRFVGHGLAGFIQKPYRVSALGKAMGAAIGHTGADSDSDSGPGPGA